MNTFIVVLFVLLCLIGCAWLIVGYIEQNNRVNRLSSNDIEYDQKEMNKVLEEKEKYKALWKEQTRLLKNETEKVIELNDKSQTLIDSQEQMDLKLKKYDSFLNRVFYKLVELKEDDSEFERIYAEKSNMAMRATTMIVLDSLLENNNLFIDELITVQKKLEKHTSSNESEMLDMLDKLGEEIVQNLEKYEFDSETIAEQLKEMSTLFYGASSGYYGFIVPSVGSSFLNDKMQGQFLDVRNGDIIKAVENWGIKVQNKIVYKARVKC